MCSIVIFITLVHVFFLSLLQALKYEKPVAEKIWSVRCNKNDHVLNDCNWCWCGSNHHFQCQARVCEDVDAFGHFKDTIQELDVGMEGHGTWRSRPTSCTPGVQYQRGTLLCICDEDSNWPNPVCRDLFRILHSIEVTEKLEDSTSQICSPTKLYLVGCNVCFCPSSGKLDAKLCTNRTCSDNDPVLVTKAYDVDTKTIHTEHKDGNVETNIDKAELKDSNRELKDAFSEANDSIQARMDAKITKEELEIYASCSIQKSYTIGRQNCECLTNNRLICKKYGDHIVRKGIEVKHKLNAKLSVCSGKTGSIITQKCNLCKCDNDGHMYCTTKKCLSTNMVRVNIKKPKFGKPATAPIDDLECIPGTTYMQDCNKCYCRMENDTKMFICTRNSCDKSALNDLNSECVIGTTYEKVCYICTCRIIDGEKYEDCRISRKCLKLLTMKKSQYASLNSLHGYCEPRHVYRNGCNLCTCLSCGKIVKCTTQPCVSRALEPVEVEIMPLQQAVSETCPKGHSYNIECNLCFCLSNGNALCTTSDCSNQLK